MRRILAKLALILCLLAPTAQALAATPISTIAREAYIIDATTGAILLDKGSSKRIPTASMSKIMTMAVVFEAIRQGRLSLNDMLPVSEKAWRMEGSKMFVEIGKKVSVENLIKGVIVQSGNDATVVLAEGLAGSEERFADMENMLAQRWGLKDSHFMNASGLPHDGHYSTPHDLAMLTYHLIKNYPEDYKYYGIPEFTWSGITQQNRNPLLGNVQGADGIKTGHTEEAGYCLIGSGARDGRRVIMVITGLESAKDRKDEGIRLMEWALNNFKIAPIINKGQTVANAPVVYGKADSVPLIVNQSAVATVPALATKADIHMKVKYNSPLVAPIKAGQQVGTLYVSGAGLKAREYPVLAAKDIAQKDFFALTLEKIVRVAKQK